MFDDYGEFCKNIRDPPWVSYEQRRTPSTSQLTNQWAISETTRVKPSEPLTELIKSVKRHNKESDSLPEVLN